MEECARIWSKNEGEGRGLRGQEGTHHHLLKGNLKLAATEEMISQMSAETNGDEGGKEKVRKKGGLKIRKVTNEERKVYKMYTERRESSRMKKKKKGSKKRIHETKRKIRA